MFNYFREILKNHLGHDSDTNYKKKNFSKTNKFCIRQYGVQKSLNDL